MTTDNREHQRDYGAPAPYFGTAPAALLSGFARIPEVEVHVVSCTRRPMASPEKLAPNLFFHSLYVPRLGWMRTGYQGCIRAVRARLRQIRPDVVHGQGTENDCAVSAVFSGYPNLLTIHGNMRRIAQVMKARPFSFLWLAGRLEALSLRRSGGVVCITEHTRRETGGLARRTWLVPNAVDDAFFSISPEPAPRPRILCVGQVYSLKNQNTLIRALDPVAQEIGFEVVFLGEAKLNQPYAAEFAELVKARPWCLHPGFANRQQLAEHLRGSTLLVQPSLEDNCPMAVLEAMAAGVPIVAAKVGGLPELVEEGQTGLLCDPHQPASIRQAVEKLLRDPALARNMGDSARKQAQARFHPLLIARKHIEIYSEGR